MTTKEKIKDVADTLRAYARQHRHYPTISSSTLQFLADDLEGIIQDHVHSVEDTSSC